MRGLGWIRWLHVLRISKVWAVAYRCPSSSSYGTSARGITRWDDGRDEPNRLAIHHPRARGPKQSSVGPNGNLAREVCATLWHFDPSAARPDPPADAPFPTPVHPRQVGSLVSKGRDLLRHRGRGQ